MAATGTDTTRDSDAIMQAAGTSLQVQRGGGTHRPAKSVGKGSAALKQKHAWKMFRNLSIGTAGVLIAAIVIGLAIGGLGFAGVMLTALTVLLAWIAIGALGQMKPPKRADLNKGDVRQMVGKTELWLEHQRAALPPPAARIVDDMGVQLDTLGMQLETIDQAHPTAREIRKLVGETLPETVDAYRRIPANLRGEKRAGATPDDQVAASLGRISAEIDSVTRQLADGALDDLAVRTRFLDYKYGADENTSPQLAAPADTPTKGAN